jgi:peptidoglycan hydrolase-like protein with peptidoglycan-binding domain
VTAVDNEPTTGPVTGTEPSPDGSEQGAPGHPRRRLIYVGLSAATVLAVAGAGAWWWMAGTSAEDTPASPGPAATATVEVGTISATGSWDGTLGRGTPYTVRSGGQGTVTWLADQGATVGRGEVLFRIDEQPVVLLSGAVPMYRDLRAGDSGSDVAQIEANLAELGYVGFTVDDEYSSSTTEAVRAWQADIGAEQTGTVARGAVVFAPGGGYVDTLRSQVGDVVAPGAAVLDITGTDQVVDVEVDIDDMDRFAVDTEVTVVLPGAEEVTGRVSATTVVEAGPDQAPDGGGGEAESIGRVQIALDGTVPDELVGAPVEVVVAVDERADVLVVPVTALLALAEGGYGLEVVADDGTTSIVPVETGLFAEGRVEVDSADVAEGTVVGVAGR